MKTTEKETRTATSGIFLFCFFVSFKAEEDIRFQNWSDVFFFFVRRHVKFTSSNIEDRSLTKTFLTDGVGKPLPSPLL